MKKILVIDDDEIFVKLLADTLSKEKYAVISASDGEKGLEMMEKEKPDLITLDMVMPKMGGFKFLEALKKKGGVQNIPILISSQLSKMKDISEGVTLGMGVGVKGYIVKASENMDMIIKTIERTLGEK
ncbi:MAG: Response regulator receiver modulated diguanylate cyclase [Parcubacteria group bacterium GW2011_GWB1_36_5]|nr:MAG: Response regulator receiver modulated diguanylate cyclase [Parcubacteria group bacterium GW2011_GWA2_36_24]KKQ07728.1 MAG: Response regulator receiver modulated diguanylate cyclase [Parcubacteria group bacterium GW2011_GWB1_36_5]